MKLKTDIIERILYRNNFSLEVLAGNTYKYF